MVKKNSQVMRIKLPWGISAAEVQVSLMETSQNAIFFLFPTTNTKAHEELLSHLQPDAAISCTGTLVERTRWSHRVAFLRWRMHGARSRSQWHQWHQCSDCAGKQVTVLERYQGCRSRIWLPVSYSKREAIEPVISLPCLLNI